MFFDLIAKRRSIRSFKKDPIEEDKIKALEKAVLYSPSSRNKEPWEFIFVKNPAVLKELSKAKAHGSAFLEEAKLAVVLCANPSLSDVWVEDLSVCGSYLLLAAQELGLGACWVQIRKRENALGELASLKVKEILSIPASLEVGLIVGFGYAKEPRAAKTEAELSYIKIHREKY